MQLPQKSRIVLTSERKPSCTRKISQSTFMIHLNCLVKFIYAELGNPLCLIFAIKNLEVIPTLFGKSAVPLSIDINGRDAIVFVVRINEIMEHLFHLLCKGNCLRFALNCFE